MNTMLPSLRDALLIRRTQWLRHWQARTPRERRWLTAAAGALAMSMVYLLLIEPAWLARERLQRSLPQLRMQSAQLHALAQQFDTLPVPGKAGALDKSALEQALQVHGLRAQRIEVTQHNVLLQFDEAPFAQLLVALDNLQKNLRLNVSDASLTATASSGQIKGRLQLQRQGDE